MPTGIFIRTEAHKLKISLALKGRKKTPEHVEKVRQALIGYKHTQEALLNMSRARTGIKHSKEHNEAISKGSLGRIVTIETRYKIGIGNSGKIHSNEQNEQTRKFMTGRKHSKESKNKMSIKSKGRRHSDISKIKQSIAMKKITAEFKKVPKRVETWIQNLNNGRKHPNKTEIYLGIKLWNRYAEEWFYTGDGIKIIGGKCPDFVNESKKKIIELFGDYWHCNPIKYKEDYYHQIKKKTAKEIWKEDAERIEIFKQNGYETLIIWEKELKKNIEQVEQKILNFNNANGRQV